MKRHNSFLFDPCWSLYWPVLKLSWLWIVNYYTFIFSSVGIKSIILKAFLLHCWVRFPEGLIKGGPKRQSKTRVLHMSPSIFEIMGSQTKRDMLWRWECLGFMKYQLSLLSAMELPGMILLPGSFSGKISSPRPERGPEPRKRISFAIFIRLQAVVFMAPLSSTKASWAARASNLFGAVTKGRPEKKMVITDMS